MFELTENEVDSLRSQIATSKIGRDGSRYSPMVFTEHGVPMLSGVLNSQQAIAVNIQIMRIFSRFRELVFTNEELMERLVQLGVGMVNAGDRYEQMEKHIELIFATLREMIEPWPQSPDRHPPGY